MHYRKKQILAQFSLLRSSNPIRFWTAAAFLFTSLFGMVAAIAVAPSTLDHPLIVQRTIINMLPLPESAQLEPIAGKFLREEPIQHGDTFAGLIARLGIQNQTTLNLLNKNKVAQSAFQQTRSGRIIKSETSPNGELVSLVFPTDGKNDKSLVLTVQNGQINTFEQTVPLKSQILVKSGEIKTSLFAATDAVGLPDSVASQMAEIFSGDIDFHRDLRAGDRFSVAYETFVQNGQVVRTGRLLASEFSTQNKRFHAIWFENKAGQGGYYTADGKSLRKAFLRSPLAFSRITSGFSLRFHPILQQWRLHKGIDYGAPTGTQVKATGDATVAFAGKQGGYGNLIILRHQGQYTTYYGHLSKFGQNIRKGTHVRQGDTIGYVGATGWATGPHLHYEFRINDVQKNPLAIALPNSFPLPPQQSKKFQAYAQPLLARLNLATKGATSRLALLD